MTPLANTTNTLLALGIIAIQAVTLFLIIMIATKDKGSVAMWFKNKALLLVTLVMGGSMIASLFYSEVIGYLPCLLCWFQRIPIYGIAIIGTIAIIKNHGNEVWSYIQTLSILGLIIAIIHVFSRFTQSEIFNCSASGPSCLQELFLKFGYIDIPVMSLSALLFVVVVAYNRKRLS